MHNNSYAPPDRRTQASIVQPRAASRTTLRAVRVSCSVQPQEAGKQVGTAAAAAALAAVLSLGSVEPAYADISGLTPCAESKAFAKVKKNEIKGLQKRLKLVCIVGGWCALGGRWMCDQHPRSMVCCVCMNVFRLSYTYTTV